jgi:hypothetical protein
MLDSLNSRSNRRRVRLKLAITFRPVDYGVAAISENTAKLRNGSTTN